ncbi:MAG: hypothetical protein MUC91_00360 [Verrucomicrobia bacterium]|nr:hypothetical protein [Verrucomicrobiota bacterium]
MKYETVSKTRCPELDRTSPRCSMKHATLKRTPKFTLSVIVTMFLALCPVSRAAAPAAGAPINLSRLGDSGLYAQTLDAVAPVEGCLRIYDLALPKFRNGVLNRAPISDWVAGYLTQPSYFTSFDQFKNLSYDKIHDPRFRYAFDNGYYLLLELQDGRYLAVLPLVSADVMSSITVYEGVSRVKLCTFGVDPFSGEAALFSWAFAADPYTATHRCWELALQSKFCKDNLRARAEKEFPEIYDHLGWCTWESFGGDITESNVVMSIKELKASPVPVRWVIVDDGYLDNQEPLTGDKNQILSFGTNGKFPRGWGPVTSLKDDASVKWIGLWRNMSGGMGGVHPDHHMPELTDHLIRRTTFRSRGIDKPGIEQDAMIVKPDSASSKAFYDAMIGNTVEGGFDFVKVDFQTYNFWMYAGTGNAVHSAHQNNQALETACQAHGMALLNCISQCNVNLFNTRKSVISRASVDVKLDNDNMARTVQSFANNMWWGDILFGDLDMYHTSNAKTAQFLTVARAISGGPVYISDPPPEFEAALIRPLIFNDGRLVRALAPAVPLPESLFRGAGANDRCYRVIAPTRHGSCAIAAFNFSPSAELGGTVSKDDYRHAAAKEQPYHGLWSIPEEGLVVYDREAEKGVRLDADYSYSVNRMKGKIFNLAPISQEWAVIGRADKYLGGCTYTIGRTSETSLELTLDESGPLLVYQRDHRITVPEGKVTPLGEGFYRVDLPVGERNKRLTITVAAES